MKALIIVLIFGSFVGVSAYVLDVPPMAVPVLMLSGILIVPTAMTWIRRETAEPARNRSNP